MKTAQFSRTLGYAFLLTMMAAIAGCVTFTSYDNATPSTVKKAKTKADLFNAVRNPVARTSDGRFYLYAFSKSTELLTIAHILYYPLFDELPSKNKQVRFLYEFDENNRVKDYKIHQCDEGTENPICSDQHDESLWAFIQKSRGDKFVSQYRQSDEVTAPLIHAWHAAAKTGDIESLEQILSKGVSPQAELDGQKVLHVAVRQGNSDTVRFLIDNGASIDVLDGTAGESPVEIAVKKFHIDIVDLLLAHGADVNARGLGGKTALYGAARQHQIEIAHRLIAGGADVNLKTDSGDVPLHVAVLNGNMTMAKILIANGADVNIGPKGETSLMAAARHGAPELVELLLNNGADVNSHGGLYPVGGDFPLEIAVKGGHTAIVELLIDNGAKVNRNWYMITPLCRAIENGDRATAELLLAHGADVNPKRVRNSPMQLAIQTQRDDLVELLRQHGANE